MTLDNLDESEAADPNRGERTLPTQLVRFGVVVLLVATALMKVTSAHHTAILQVAYAIPRWLTFAVVQIELLLASLLLLEVRPRTTWRFIQGLFLAFAFFSLYRGLMGAESCGCFGDFKMSPWWTLLLDGVVLAALTATLPSNNTYNRQSSKLLMAAALYAIAAMASSVWMLASQADSTNRPGWTEMGDGLTILEPSEWVGKPFPLAELVPSSVNIEEGSWIVLVYHHDCPRCQKVLPRYVELADNSAEKPNPTRILLLEVPPFGEDAVPRTSAAIYGRLSGQRQWFIQAPIEIIVTEGVVQSASLELPSIGGADAGANK